MECVLPSVPSDLDVDALFEVVEQHSGIPLNHGHHVAFGEKVLQFAKLGGYRGLDVGQEQVRLAVHDLKAVQSNTTPWRGGERKGYSFLAHLCHLTIGHVPLSRRSPGGSHLFLRALI